MSLILALVLCVAPTLLTAFIASRASPRLYRHLDRPRWAPPARAFGPVWAVLYLSMAIASTIHARRAGLSPGLSLFWIQLVLNAAWSWIFFEMRRPRVALVELTLLIVAAVGTAALFARVSPWAGALLVPYLAWLTVAFALNFALIRRNPPGSGAWTRALPRENAPQGTADPPSPRRAAP